MVTQKTTVACQMRLADGEVCEADVHVTLKLPTDPDEEPELLAYRATCGHGYDNDLEYDLASDAFDMINLERSLRDA
jgi:hypothetical protein